MAVVAWSTESSDSMSCALSGARYCSSRYVVLPTDEFVFQQCWVCFSSNRSLLIVIFERDCLAAPVTMSETWPDEPDHSDAEFPPVERFDLLSLSFPTDWINVSNCVTKGATTEFTLLSISLQDILRSTECDCKMSSPPLIASPGRWSSPISTKCPFVVRFPSDMLTLSGMKRDWGSNFYSVKQNFVFTEFNSWKQWLTFSYTERETCNLFDCLLPLSPLCQ